MLPTFYVADPVFVKDVFLIRRIPRGLPRG